MLLGTPELCTLQVRAVRPPIAWQATVPPSAAGEWDGPVLAVRALRTPLAPGAAARLDWAPSGWLRASHARRRAPAARAGRLADLGGAFRVDDLGVIVLAIDPQGRILVAKRARALGLRAGAWTATASGAVDPTLDRGGRGHGLGVGLAAAVRELTEETGLRPAGPDAVEPLGLVREWRRAGKPELVVRMTVRSHRALWLRPSSEISVLRAIPDTRLRADPTMAGHADLPLRVALALHWQTPRPGSAEGCGANALELPAVRSAARSWY